ncbi:NADAR family protein [Actinoplanes sp. N902-109]|uniref:NADAR family protein n=1 Tax=Actinoplanes sp. (strain N902-109) TaxID=649831 RepID=UPI0003295D7A|nr:NADAR family protein [Actinoplanes sp. N902-109]AGL15986.1 vegetative cell wall protein gp1 [Actinoplanes sp. N902-109]
MTWQRRTYRDVDGQRVDGVCRSMFVTNAGDYYLDDLVVYADGAVDAGDGLTDLDGLRRRLASGRVATTLEEGARAYAHRVGSWRFADVLGALTPELVLGEVADQIDRLNERPDSAARCRQAVQAYLSDMSEQNRLAVRESYLAIPEHLRIFTLGDMDRKDFPLRVLITELGEQVYGDPDGPVITRRHRDRAVQYFRETARAIAGWQATEPADGPARPHDPTVTLAQTYYPNGWPDDPGIHVLQNDYASSITVRGRSYPTVSHAYWALSTGDPAWHDRIAAAERVYDAVTLAGRAPRRDGWPGTRLAVMAELLRAKFAQHPRLADVLLATGDARIVCTDAGSDFWSAGPGGTNWFGRLLEVARSEVAAARTQPLPGEV